MIVLSNSYIASKIDNFYMKKLMVVTGGTKGIGRAVLEKFAREGFDVATCSRKLQDLEQLVVEVEQEYQVRVFTHVADLAVKDQITGFTDYINLLNRKVDVLVNNAGYFVPGQVMDEKEGVLESMIQANLYSAYYTTRGLINGMRKSKSGHIFNMCSIASIKAYPNGGSYAITKFALLGFSKVLREELKELNIRVTAILPGATLTASWEGVDLPEDRFMKPEDVADAVHAAYALSKRSVIEEMIIRPQLGDL
jgi:short-subunit dehydrogenase